MVATRPAGALHADGLAADQLREGREESHQHHECFGLLGTTELTACLTRPTRRPHADLSFPIMGQQTNKIIKRRRRAAYLKRRAAKAKLAASGAKSK